jgi:hypothetical protein
VSHTGECEVPNACGGSSGATCEEGQFCKHEDGACEPDAEGICTDVRSTCPAIYAPVCGCDGTTYSSSCYADAAGVAVASEGACAQGEACGGLDGLSCEAGSFCKPTPGDCSENAEGTCMPIPSVCPSIYAPVCGCDETTYDNPCFAHVASVGVAHAGACAADTRACGGSEATTCDSGQYCARPEGVCAEDAEGLCLRSPIFCPPVLDAVCGCDGTTYSNGCIAHAVGVTVDHTGECVATP